ncbi:DUF2637 domain-containing protein [Pilimelia anulata]|nr:DUF2637 domain-containing protein [Pilimelia anulata]
MTEFRIGAAKADALRAALRTALAADPDPTNRPDPNPDRDAVSGPGPNDPDPSADPDPTVPTAEPDRPAPPPDDTSGTGDPGPVESTPAASADTESKKRHRFRLRLRRRTSRRVSGQVKRVGHPGTTPPPIGDVAQLKRLRWAVRAVLALGVAASIAGNVLHARDNIVSQVISAWSPLALLLTVELISRVPVHRRGLAVARWAATSLIAGIAAWVSYWHMAAVAARYGETADSAHLLPLSVDGLIVVASICLVELGGRITTNTTRMSGFVKEVAR